MKSKSQASFSTRPALPSISRLSTGPLHQASSITAYRTGSGPQDSHARSHIHTYIHAPYPVLPQHTLRRGCSASREYIPSTPRLPTGICRVLVTYHPGLEFGDRSRTTTRWAGCHRAICTRPRNSIGIGTNPGFDW